MSQQPPWVSNKPAMMAVIREDECIGCTKCIPDCPTDAIMGAAKLMHTVITDICTGCELCVPTCPVDCIDILPLPQRTTEQTIKLDKLWSKRFNQHNTRQQKEAQEGRDKYQQAAFLDELDSVEARKRYIEDVLKRTRAADKGNT